VKILYIHQYFKTPEEGGSIRSYYLAKGLVDNYYEVEMISTHNKKEYVVKDVDGITVHYLPVFYDNSLGFWQRILSFVKFIYLACKLIPKLDRPDICYAMSTPLTVGLITLWIKRKFKIPYYFEIGDLWPEAPIQMGFITNPIVKYCLYALERKIYSKADKIIALSPGIRDNIESVVPDKDVYMIPNMADCSFFTMESKETRYEELFNTRGKFVISYVGAAGKANHLEYLLGAAIACQTSGSPVEFLIAAYGSELTRVKRIAQDKKINNVNFLPYQSKSNLKKVLNVTDAIFISYADFPVLQTGSPNKFFDGLAAGKIIILNTSGWLRQITELNKCGFYYDPKNPETFIKKLCPFLKDPNMLFSYQKNARNVAEQYYSKELQIQKLLKVFNNKHQMKIKEDSAYILTE
jgi:glycosyltransferase involved in cell wall biosynthesis